MPGNRWPHVRAVAIALVIAIGLVDGCPLPPPGHVAEWQAPIVDVVRPVQRAVMEPFRWIQRGLLITQHWTLFQVAGRDRYRLEVAGRSGPFWELLFRAGDPEHAAYAELLLDERVRWAWNPGAHPAEQYEPFAHWFLGRVLADHPELIGARMQFERIVIDDGTVRGTGAYVMPIERTRGGP